MSLTPTQRPPHQSLSLSSLSLYFDLVLTTTPRKSDVHGPTMGCLNLTAHVVPLPQVPWHHGSPLFTYLVMLRLLRPLGPVLATVSGHCRGPPILLPTTDGVLCLLEHRIMSKSLKMDYISCFLFFVFLFYQTAKSLKDWKMIWLLVLFLSVFFQLLSVLSI